ncbi:tetratricopeptide repeat protein [Arachnia propionica]|uniref:tetratricopeptide repeat protein n=1 Tax=Arachnia propionica TaxID=1750 RepID=UPI00398F9448
MLGAERIRGIVAGLEMKYARTRWRSDNLRGDHDRSVHAPPRIPVLEPGRLEPAPGIERGPLQLIDARTGIVPFADRDELTALIDWACAPQAGNGRDLALAVVTGAGGAGRTRLAVELCSALGRNGWGTGFVPDPADLGDAELTWLAEMESHLLVVLDHAEERRTGNLARLLVHLRDRVAPTRVVLVARNAGQWLTDLLEGLEHRGEALGDPLGIALPHEPGDAAGIVARAAGAFARHMRRPEPGDVQIPRDQPWTTLDLVLLGWLLAARDNAADLPGSRDELYDEILRRELSAWQAEAIRRGLGELPEATWRTAAATLSLLRPVTPEEVRDVLSRLPEASSVPDTEGYARLLFEMLSRPAGGCALRPESIAEHLIIATFVNGEGCEDPEKLLGQVLPEPPGAPGPDGTGCSTSGTGQTDARDARDERVCDAITRCTSRGDAAAVRLARSVLHHRPHLWVAALDVAQRQGGPFVTALEEALKGGADLPAITILAAIWPGDPVLRGVAVAALARVLETSREPMNLLGLSTHLADAGDRVGALEMARKAVRVHRESADEDSTGQGLILPLANLASRLWDVGDHAGALNVEREVVRIHRRLTGEFRVFFGSRLVVSLAGCSARLVEAGNSAQAVEVLREAVGIHRETIEVYRGLSAELRRGFGPFLAMPLSALATQLAELGDFPEALVAAREVVDLQREVVEETAARGDDVPACATDTPPRAEADRDSRDVLPDKESGHIEHGEFIYIEVLLALAAVSSAEQAHDVAGNPGKAHEAVRGFIGEANVSAILCALRLRPELADHVPCGRFAAALHACLTYAPGEAERHLSGVGDHVAPDDLDIFRRCVHTLGREPDYADALAPVAEWLRIG